MTTSALTEEEERLLSSLDCTEEELTASLCRDSFADFVKTFWDEVPGTEPLKWGWHMQVLCDELQFIAERVFRRLPVAHELLINISPGTSKSTICSILFQPWTWTRMPTARHVIATHTDSLVLDLATKSRSVIESEKYRNLFPEIRLKPDQSGKEHYANTFGGDRFSCTVGGRTPTGLHGHFVSWDDPTDPKKALSEVELKTASDFKRSILDSRKVDKEVSVFFGVMQRFHELDPSGVILDHAKNHPDEAFPVRHICLPADLDPDPDRPGEWLVGNVNPPELAKRYVDGLMDPVRLTRRFLRSTRAGNEYTYQGQYRQKPVSQGGQMFKEEYFNRRAAAAPFHAKRIWYCDRASTPGDKNANACYTAMVLLARDDAGTYYVEEVVHGQWEPSQRNEKIRAAYLRSRARYGPSNTPHVYIEKEGGSGGLADFRDIARCLEGAVVREDPVAGKGSKEVRAQPWSTALAAKNVVLCEGAWDVNGYVKEHCLFPMGLKDRVDASSGAYNVLVNMRQAGTIRVYRHSGGKKGKPRIVVASKEELASFIVEEDKTLLISLQEPSNNVEGTLTNLDKPLHGITHLLDWTPTAFADIQPEEYQATWEEPILPYGMPASQIAMTPDHGKRLWRMLLKDRNPAPTLIVVQDAGGEDRRGVSVALALCDTLNIPKDSVECLRQPDRKYEGASDAPNGHVYRTTKASRGLVL